MKYIDLHCHPSFKSTFQNQDPKKKKRNNIWNEIPSPASCSSILRSQSSLSQLIKCSNLVCVPIHPVEPGMVDNYLIRLISIFPKIVSHHRLINIINGVDSSNKLLHQETDYFQVDKDPDNRKKVQILTRMSDYNENNTDTIYVILAVEGSHPYYGNDNIWDHPNEMIKRFESWIKENQHLVLYQSITHLTNNFFANHAYGNKILPKEKMVPSGFGIRAHGFKLIDKIYEHGLVVDIKHMSLVSRLQFYQYHSTCHSDKPIIFSHCGVTGFSWDEILGETKNGFNHVETAQECNDAVAIVYNEYKDPYTNIPYYPLSINLYDNDIRNVVESNGLICLELDLRILGGDQNYLKEFVSKSEYAYWKQDFSTKIGKQATQVSLSYNDYLIDVQDHAEEIRNLGILGGLMHTYDVDTEKEFLETHFFEQLFANQLLHIHRVVKDHLPKRNAWDHICIGSDFDGLIEPLPCCKNAGDMDYFADSVTTELKNLANKVGIDLGEDLKTIKEKLFFKNALAFIKSRFP